MMPDHVHLVLSIPPKISVSSFMGYLKGKSALMMFETHDQAIDKLSVKEYEDPFKRYRAPLRCSQSGKGNVA